MSVGYNSADYNANQGYEEGVVEETQRLLRGWILTRLSVTTDETVLQLGDEAHPFNRYIDALERVRMELGDGNEQFYLDLLSTPIRDRHAFLVKKALALPRADRIAALTVLSASAPVLREK